MLTDEERKEYQEFRVMTQAHLASLQEMLNTSNTKIKELEDREVLQEKLIGALSHNVQHHENIQRAHKNQIADLNKLAADALKRTVVSDKRLDALSHNDVINGDAIRANDILYGEWLDKHGQRLERLEASEGVAGNQRAALTEVVADLQRGESVTVESASTFAKEVHTRLSELERAEGNAATRIEQLQIKEVRHDDRLSRHWEAISSIVLRADGACIQLGRDRGEIDELEKKAEGLRISIAMTDSVVKDLSDDIDSQAHRSDHSELMRRLLELEVAMPLVNVISDITTADAKEIRSRLSVLEQVECRVEVSSEESEEVDKRLDELEETYDALYRAVGENKAALYHKKESKRITAADCQSHGRYAKLMELGERVASNYLLGVDLRKAAEYALNAAKGDV